MSDRVVELQTGTPSKFTLLWRDRRILLLMVSRDLKVKYAGSLLGYLWSVLDPLLMAGVYWFVFTVLMHRTIGEQPYIVFLLCGMLPWQFFQGGLRSSMNSLSKDAKLVRSTNTPREIWVLRTIATKFVEFMFSLPVIAFFAIISHAQLTWYVVFFPVAVLIQITLLFGLGMILAPLAVLYTDVDRVLPVLLRLMFYFSPILYGTQDIEKRLGPTAAHLFTLNPLTGIFDLYRTAFFTDQWSGWHGVAVSTGWAVIALVAGLLIFPRLEGTVLKEI
jgi:ABC-2 type transport system permease protein